MTGVARPCGVARAISAVGVVDEAAPHRGPLLGLAHQHQSRSTRRDGFVLVRTRQVRFGLADLEAHNRHPADLLERLELRDESFVVAVQEGRRRNGAAGPIEQELDRSELVLDPRDVTPDPDAIH